MTNSWAQRAMVGLDFESTGIDPEQDRAVTASLIAIEPARQPVVHSFLINPGIEIPQGAIDVHGVTNEKARAEGMSPAEAFGRLNELLAEHWTPEVPLVIYNAPYDLTMLDRESVRNGLPALDMAGRYVVDPLVIDRHADRYRKGGRKLADVCRHYRVELVDAHTSDADTLATMRLAYKIAARYPQEVGQVTLATLHASQIGWSHEWATRMATFLRKEATRMVTSWARAKAGDSQGADFVRAQFNRLAIGEDPSDELVAQAVAGTRAKADDFASCADAWPMRKPTAVGID